MWKKCENCDTKYEYYPIECLKDQSDLCIFCRFDDNCEKTTKKFRCKNERCLPCYERSFLSYENADLWDYKKNQQTPREVAKNSNKKYFFKCKVCQHEFDMVLSDISRSIGRPCSFCSSKKRCDTSKNCEICFAKSFASHPMSKNWHKTKNEPLIPINLAKNSHIKIWFTCHVDSCKHDFKISLDKISKGIGCPYCSNKKRCDTSKKCETCFTKSFASHPRAINWDYEKNDKSPQEVAKCSNNKFFFICNYGHKFAMALCTIVCCKCWCPRCKNKTEKKFADWLEDQKFIFEREKRFPWCKNEKTERLFPFDFVLEKEKIIIEIDGRQHFSQVFCWQTPEIIQERDKFKQDKALQNGYTLIRILQEDILKKTYWEDIIKNNIYIRDEPELIFICENNEYENTHSSKIYKNRTVNVP